MARGYGAVSASIAAQNTFTDHIHPADKPDRAGLNLSITGLTDSTVTVQRSFDGGTNWADVVQYVTGDGVNNSVQKVIEANGEGMEAFRVGIKTGDYGTDTVVCRLSH